MTERVRPVDMIILGVIVTAWAVSLALPVFTYVYLPNAVFNGWVVLTTGYAHLLVLEFAWAANFLILTGVATLLFSSKPAKLLRYHSLALLWCFISGMANAVFMRFFEWSAIHAGFWLWEAMVLVCGAWFYNLSRRVSLA